MEKSTHTSDDNLLGNTVHLRQFVSGHRVGTDAVLLAASTPKQGSLVDAGASSGAVGLMASRSNPNRKLYFIEKEADLADLCRQNISLNGRSHAHVVCASLFDPSNLSEHGIQMHSAHVVATNPPFMDPQTGIVSPDTKKAAAHVLSDGTLHDWLQACAQLVAPKGFLCIIHKAERIGDILQALHPRFGGIRLRSVHVNLQKPANRVVVRGIKGSKTPLRIDAPLILYDHEGKYTPEAYALHNGQQEDLFQ